VTIIVADGAKGWTVPSSSVFTDPKTKTPAVFVVKNGKVRRTPVEIGQDDGSRTEILSGLTGDDVVVSRPTSELSDGAEVETEMAADVAAKKADRS